MLREGNFKKRRKILSIFVILVLCFLTFILWFETKVYKGIPMLLTSDDIYIINTLEIQPKGEMFSDIYFVFIELINYQLKDNIKKKYKYYFKTNLIPINLYRLLSFKKDGVKYKIRTSGYQIKINEDFCIHYAGGHSNHYTVNDKYIIGIYYESTEKELQKCKVCIYDKINQKYNYIIEYANLEFQIHSSKLRDDYLILGIIDYSNRKRYYDVFNLKSIMNKSNHLKIKIHSIYNYFIFNNELRVLDSNEIKMYKGDEIEKINLDDKHIRNKDYVIFFNDDNTILYNKETILLFKDNNVKNIENVGDFVIEKIIYHYNNRLVIVDKNNKVLLFDVSNKKTKKTFKYFKHFYYLNKLFILSENNHLYKFENNKFNKVYLFKTNYKYIKIYNYESYIFLLDSKTGNGIIIYQNIIQKFCIHSRYINSLNEI